MNRKQAEKLIEITHKTYDLIGGDFAGTREKPWPEMEILAGKYVKDKQQILDLGCGNGRFLRVLKDKKLTYIGVDGSESLLFHAKKRLDNWDIKTIGPIGFRHEHLMEIEKLGYKNRFDIVFMFSSFCHIPTEDLRLEILTKIRKMIKPKGLLVMTNWNLWQISKSKKSVWRYKFWNIVHGEKYKTENLDEIKEFMNFKDIMTFWQSRDGNKRGGLYYRAFTRGELKRLFRKSGLEIIENYYSSAGKKHWWGQARNIVTVGRNVKAF